MGADIEHGAHRTVFLAHDEQGLAGSIVCEVVTRRLDFGTVPDDNWVPAQHLLLFRQQSRIGIVTGLLGRFFFPHCRGSVVHEAFDFSDDGVKRGPIHNDCLFFCSAQLIKT